MPPWTTYAPLPPPNRQTPRRAPPRLACFNAGATPTVRAWPHDSRWNSSPASPEVLESALEILNVEPDSLETSAAVLARVHLNCGWPDLAERHARVAVSESPERVDVRLTLAEALWRLGRLSACEAECRVVADQAEECVRAAVMRAHILSERGRTAEGQELLDRIGRIDPEFREARELLGTLEVHRLVLPGVVEIDLPPELVRQSDGTAEAVAEPSPADGAQPSASPDGNPAPAEAQTTVDGPDGQAETPGESDVHDQPSQPVEDLPGSEVQVDTAGSVAVTGEEATVSSEQLRLDDVAEEPESLDAVEPSADEVFPVSSDAAADSVAPTDEAEVGADFSTFDWARHLIEQSEWTEAERVLTDIVTANDPDVSRVDGLLLEAVAHRELRGSVWKLLGDHYMQTGRPQAARGRLSAGGECRRRVDGMTSASDLHAGIQRLPGVTGAAVWRIGKIPTGDLGGRGGSIGPGLLSASIGTMEQAVETMGLGQIAEIWFVTQETQCLALRSGQWQAVVIGGLDLDVDSVRDGLTSLLAANDEPDA